MISMERSREIRIKRANTNWWIHEKAMVGMEHSLPRPGVLPCAALSDGISPARTADLFAVPRYAFPIDES